MRRTVLLGVVVLLAVIIGYGYGVTRRERIYRQLVAQGDRALEGGDPAAAVLAFDRAVARRPESMVGYLKRGTAHYRQGNLDAAAADLEAAARLDSASPRVLELRGDVALARQRHDEAAAHYGASVALDDRSPRVLYKLGLAQEVAGRSADAHAALTRAVELDGRFAEAHYLLGLALRGMNRARDAEASLQRAIALAPGLTAAREELADLYGAQGRRLARIAALEALLRDEPTASRHMGVAEAYAEAGQTLRAVRVLRRAIDMYPDHPGLYLTLGNVWLAASERGRDGSALGSAVDALERAVVLDASGAALTALGRTYLLAGRAREASATFDRAASRLPVDPALFIHLAELSDRAGDRAAAAAARRDHDALVAVPNGRVSP